jgi:spermidine synthase
MTSEREEFFYHENIIHPVAVAHPNLKRALIIGGGDGGSSEELLKHPSIEQVVLCELDPDVVEISKKHFFAVHRGVFDNPKLDLRIGDGFAYLRETEDKFDLIVLDLPDPIGPAEALYTAEFYACCKHALAAGGAVALHIGSPVARPDRVQTHVAALRQVFSLVRPYALYIPLYGSLWGLACASDVLDPLALTSEQVERIIRERRLTHLQYYNGDTHRAVFALPNFMRELLR